MSNATKFLWIQLQYSVFVRTLHSYPFLVLAEIKILTSYHTIMMGYMQVGEGQMIDTPPQLSANTTTIMELFASGLVWVRWIKLI